MTTEFMSQVGHEKCRVLSDAELLIHNFNALFPVSDRGRSPQYGTSRKVRDGCA